ncbi:MAG: ABC transporter permease [Planctomycetota bacterium]
MIPMKLIPFVLKQLARHRTRTALTLGGVGLAVFLFCAVQAVQQGAAEATQLTAADTTLVVYRANRYCPFTSRLPEYYLDRIKKIPGVKGAMPMRIVVNNCRTSLDVITFRGVPKDQFVAEQVPRMRMIQGNASDWSQRSDAVLLGEVFARRRGLKVGDRFDGAGVTVYVSGIVESEEAQDRNVGYVDLPFLQQATGNRKLGIVTQFNVKVDDPKQLEEVAKAIDEEFKDDPEPTRTSPEKSFVARAAKDVIEIVGFTKWLAWGCLAAVMALVGNAIVLAVQDRIREHAVMQTLGFTPKLIARLIVAEGLLLGIVGGLIGAMGAYGVTWWGAFAISSEGLSIQMSTDPTVVWIGLLASSILGVVAGLFPAWQAARREIVACFRAI